MNPPQQRIERANAVEPLERKHDPAVQRDRTRRVARATAARNDRDVVRVTPGNDLGDLFSGAGQRDSIRVTAYPARLRLVGEVRRGRRHDLGRNRGSQLTLDGCDGTHCASALSTAARPSRSTGSPCDTSTSSIGNSSSFARSARRRSSWVKPSR